MFRQRKSVASLLQAALHGSRPRAVRKSNPLRLEPLESREVPAAFLVTTTADNGNNFAPTVGSLRQAILNANASPGADVIQFDIATTDANHLYYKNDGIAGRVSLTATTTASNDGTIADIDPDYGHSWYTIRPGSYLPTITDPVIIDGHTQAGSSPNTLGVGSDAVLRIELDGSMSGGSGLILASDGNTVRGLVINNFPGYGIATQYSDSNMIAGNFIGTDPSGNVSKPNDWGIKVISGRFNTIGGAYAADRNVVSGNKYDGINLQGTYNPTDFQTVGNVVRNNYAGTNAAGTAALPNGSSTSDGYGISVGGGSGNLVVGNLISGNSDGGLVLGDWNSTVQGNLIGTDATGTSAITNNGNLFFPMYGNGIYVYGSNNMIGGAAPGEGNLIAYNAGAGIYVTVHGQSYSFSSATIRGNSIHSNNGLGIDLAPELVSARGPNGNDEDDADVGPNDYQNFPLVAAASSGGSGTVVTGSLNSTASTGFTLDFYASPAADSSGYGEGRVYLGSAPVTTDSNGDATFSVTVDGIAPAGWVLSATATGPSGTSEFSGTTTITAANDTPGELTIVGGSVNEGGTFTLTGSFTDADANDEHTVIVNWGEGDPEVFVLPAGERLFSFDHVYADDHPSGTSSDSYAVSVSVSDGTSSADADATVVVNNTAPSNFSWSLADTDLNEGDTTVVRGTFTDPGLGDVHTVTINWGDGAPQTYVLPTGDRNFEISHRYADDNPTATPQDDYVIRVFLSDDDLGAGRSAPSFIYGLKSQTAGAVPRTGPPTHLFTFLSDGTAFTDVGTVRVGGTAIDADGLAFSPSHGLLAYQVFHAPGTLVPTSSQLVSVDPATAVATPIGSALAGRVIRGAAFDAWDRLWVIDHAQDQLLQIDPATGAILGDEVILTIGGNPYDLGDLTDIAIRDDGAMVVADGAGASFYTLDSGTGALTLIAHDTELQAGQSGTTAPTGIGMVLHGDTIFTYDAQGTDDIYQYDTSNGFARSPVFIRIIPSFNSGQGDLAATATGVKVAVHNLNPSIDSLSATAAYGTGIVRLNGAYSDVGADTHTLTIDWGHGSPETVTVTDGVFHLTHQYPTSGIEPGNQYSISVTLADDDTGSASATAPFATSTISGIAYQDTDGDGTQDAGEPALADWIIYVDGDNDGARDAGEPWTTTGGSGEYTLGELPAGTQRIRLEGNPGWTATGSPDVGVGSGDSVEGVGLGAYRNAIIRGIAYDDENGDGRRDSGENPLGGWTVFLDRDRDGQLDPGEARTTTNANGEYAFDGIVAGKYRVRIIVPNDWGNTSANPVMVTVRARQSGQIFTANFGSTPLPASLSGFVWNDSNDNGDIDRQEVAIAGAIIELTGVDDRGSTVSRSTRTNSQGHYEFENLRPGTYAIHEIQPNGFADGRDEVGNLGGTLSNDLITSINVDADDCGRGYNFGERGGVALHRGQTATIGFWQNKNGQALIKSLNGGPTSTALGNWLATSFPNLYGSSAGASNLTDKTNAQVAAYYLTLFKAHGTKLGAQVLATAFAVYATDSDLAGTAARAYGFEVSSGGTGEARFKVGCNGEAFGVADRTTLSIREILDATNSMSAGGVIYLKSCYRQLANDVYDAINNIGDIG